MSQRAAFASREIALATVMVLAGCEGTIPGVPRSDGGVISRSDSGRSAHDAAATSPSDASALPEDAPSGADARPPTPDAAVVESACGSPIEQEELRLTNLARAEGGLGPLVCDEGLTRAARLHSQDMCDNRYFTHDSQDGTRFSARITAQGVTWRRVGENIARGQRTPEVVHTAWMGSEGHRANIMNGAFGRIGIGYVECAEMERWGPLWTQDFAD